MRVSRKAFAGPHREVRVQRSVLVRRRCQCLSGIIKSAADDADAAAAVAAAAADAAADGDAALSYDQRSVRAGPPVGPARPVRPGI